MSTNIILPRFIRLRDAADYLGMDRNRFNQEVRPFIVQMPIGKQGIAFDRLDLDAWADHYRERVGRPKLTNRGELWVKKLKTESLDSTSVANTGTLIKKSLDSELQDLLAPSHTKMP